MKDSNDFTGPTKAIWYSRRFILHLTIGFFFLGLLTAILSEKEYTASLMFIPQTGESSRSSLGNFGGIASAAGIDLGGLNSTSEITPILYPKMITNIKILQELINAPLRIENGTKVITYANYYEDIYQPNILHNLKKYSIGLPGIIISAFRGEELEIVEKEDTSTIIKLSNRETSHFSRLISQINIKLNEREGYVELSVTMPNPLLAAQIAQHAQELLQKEVIAFKISSAREHLDFTEFLYLQKKVQFEESQNKLSSFRDRNQNLSSALAINELEKLQAEYNLAFNIYLEVAKQLEQAKLQVSKDTPIFSVIQSVTIPTIPSAPNHILIIILFSLFGLFISVGYVIFSDLLKAINFKDQVLN